MNTKLEKPLTPLDIIVQVAKINTEITHFIFCEYVFPSEKQKENDKFIYISREEILEKHKLSFYLNTLSRPHAQLGIFSKCMTANNEVKHLALMDLQLAKNTQSVRLIVNKLKQLAIKKGYILETGLSYHFYGLELLTEAEWLIFMGEMLLTNFDPSTLEYRPFTDAAYIAFSLRHGGCVLRLTTLHNKSFEPKVISNL